MNCKAAIQLWLPFGKKGEQIYVAIATEGSSEEVQLMESVICQDNMVKAYKQVKRNGGSPGIDGMTVEELGPYLREHWCGLREALLTGTYLHRRRNSFHPPVFYPVRHPLPICHAQMEQ